MKHTVVVLVLVLAVLGACFAASPSLLQAEKILKNGAKDGVENTILQLLQMYAKERTDVNPDEISNTLALGDTANSAEREKGENDVQVDVTCAFKQSEERRHYPALDKKKTLIGYASDFSLQCTATGMKPIAREFKNVLTKDPLGTKIVGFLEVEIKHNGCILSGTCPRETGTCNIEAYCKKH